MTFCFAIILYGIGDILLFDRSASRLCGSGEVFTGICPLIQPACPDIRTGRNGAAAAWAGRERSAQADPAPVEDIHIVPGSVPIRKDLRSHAHLPLRTHAGIGINLNIPDPAAYGTASRARLSGLLP
ncbi:MAG: hypothetical protein R3D66_01780 [Alphaproteobacteria bacterium]